MKSLIVVLMFFNFFIFVNFEVGAGNIKSEWDNQNLSVISLWTIKEAAFKAISSLSMRMGSGDDQLTLKKIWINKGYFGLTMTDRPPLGIYQLQTIKVDQKTFIVAQAFIFKERSAVTG